MKIAKKYASDTFFSSYRVEEYDSLEECVTTLLREEDFGRFVPEVIISMPEDFKKNYEYSWKRMHSPEVDFIVEIYDDYRE